MKYLFTFLGACASIVVQNASAQEALIGMNNYGPLGNPIYSYSYMLAPAQSTYVELLARVQGGFLPLGPVGGDSSLIKLTEDGFFDAGYAFIPGMNGYATTEFVLTAYQWIENYLQPMGSVQWTQKTGGWLGPPYLPFLVDLENPPLHFIPEPSTVVLGLMGGACLFTFCHKRKKTMGSSLNI